MNSAGTLTILGASARAAAQSAVRAGYRPWCVDLFADRDLRALGPTGQLSAELYPAGFVSALTDAPPGPWIYTGGLENHRGLIRRLARLRPLWGNDPVPLAKARSPEFIANLLQTSGLPCLEVRLKAEGLSPRKRWLSKPLASAGGGRIHFFERQTSRGRTSRHYYQEFVEGDPYAAIYCGDGAQARLLGSVRQLIGETWLNAASFQYCGNVGPITLSPHLRRALTDLGNVLAQGCGLRGLFGVDFILRDDQPWPVEVNPRYTASVEVLEHALSFSALADHARAFEPGVPSESWPVYRSEMPIVGKAIVFARDAVTFPAEGPWLAALARTASPFVLPAHADIPGAGERIPAHRPILTVMTQCATFTDCLQALRSAASDLDRRLFRS